MKRLSFIVMAGLIALGLTQCKKNEPTNNDTEGVKITLNINNGNGGGRLHIQEGTSTTTDNPIVKVLYDVNDVIYVCSNGSYVGYLTCTSADSDGSNSTFTGTISSSASTSHPLQFIYLGGHTATENRAAEFAANPTAPFTFSLEDQSYVLHVVSTAASNETFASTTTSYTLAGGKMRNKCALVKFTFNEGNFSSAEEATINGVYNHLNIGFDGSVSTIISNGKGDIATFKSTNAVRYAVVPAGQDLSGIIEIEGYEGTYSIAAPDYNGFIQATVTLTPEPASGFNPEEFTIDNQGTTVYFSRSNAHFDPTNSDPTNRWYFAENQYDYEGTWHSNEPVSHFAWGTWFYDNPNIPVPGIITYDSYGKPYQLNPIGSYYTNNFYNTATANVTIGGENWRVMTNDEWGYLLSRTKEVNGVTKPLYGFGNVHGINGLIVLPDNWNGNVDGSFTYGTASDWPNVYTESTTVKWAWMEGAGAVFLPAAGYRYKGAATNSSINYYHSDVVGNDKMGCYWSSTASKGANQAYSMYFENGRLETASLDYEASYGFCVRFVKAAAAN